MATRTQPPGEEDGSGRRWPPWLPLLLAVLTALAFLPAAEAGLGVGVASLLVLLLSPHRDRDSGLLLLVLALGVLLAARSVYPGLGLALGGLYLLARSRSPERAWARGTLYELVTAVAAVALVVVLLQRGAGTWPAMVAVESCSMEPNVRVGDLVFVAGPGRSSIATQQGDLIEMVASEARVAHGGGVGIRGFGTASACVARERPDGGGCARRGSNVSGDVIVFYPNGNAACTPIIHRAVTWLPDNGSFGGRTFPRGGFITKGDNNGPWPAGDPLSAADQLAGRRDVCPNTQPVRPEWLVGVAKFRVPWLGYVRLLFGNWPENCATGS